jgi:hypothetical protein
MLDVLRADIDTTLALTGRTSVADLDALALYSTGSPAEIAQLRPIVREGGARECRVIAVDGTKVTSPVCWSKLLSRLEKLWRVKALLGGPAIDREAGLSDGVQCRVWRLNSREHHVVSVHLLEAEAAGLRDAEDRVKIPAVPCFRVEPVL